MIGQIASFFTNGFEAVSGWFMAVIDKTGMGGLLIAAFVIYQSFRLLLAPLVGNFIGAAQSDTARTAWSSTKMGKANAQKRASNSSKRKG